MIRLGLCWVFRDEPIRFRDTTAAAIGRMSRAERLDRLSNLALANAVALRAALTFRAGNGIGCFRVNSQIPPLKTHPNRGDAIDDRPGAAGIVARFRARGERVRDRGLRTCFHPDQFVVLNSRRPAVVEWIGADVINIHGGGAFGDKPAALARAATHGRGQGQGERGGGAPVEKRARTGRRLID